ncbi:MAG: hypothetical protein R8K20_01365 [Gallionellaceae bacterium]
MQAKTAGALVGVLLVLALIAYEQAPQMIAQKIKGEVNGMPLRVRMVVAWRVLCGNL